MNNNRDTIIKNIPISYNETAHISIPTLIGILIVSISVFFISNFSWYMLLASAVTVFISFGFEWYVHKNILHKPFRFLEFINTRHIAHHKVYTNKNMTMLSKKERYLILMPAYAILAVLAFIFPNVLLFSFLFGKDIALTILITMIVFFLSYEWLHYSYHLSENSFVGRMNFIKFMRKHHQRHHNPRLIQYNFNVTLPIFDWIMGTKV